MRKIIKKQIFTFFAKVFLEYIKRIMSRFKEHMKDQNIDVLYNLCLNVLIALANPVNYAHQFKQVLKMNKYAFDPAETKYLNDNLDKVMIGVDDNNEVSNH